MIEVGKYYKTTWPGTSTQKPFTKYYRVDQQEDDGFFRCFSFFRVARRNSREVRWDIERNVSLNLVLYVAGYDEITEEEFMEALQDLLYEIGKELT